MTANSRLIVAAVSVGLLAVPCLVQAGVGQPSRQTLTHAVNDYLSDHGDLCVGKFTWPRVVTAEDVQARTNDAVQLPVLERLGLVAAVSVDSGKSYSLTEKGRRYYLQKKRMTLGAHDQSVEHDEDLCVARLSLDKVVNWSPIEQVHGHLATVVRYTYHIEAADWMADPEARRVFPVVDRIIRNQGNMLMSVNVRFEGGRWRPVLPTL